MLEDVQLAGGTVCSDETMREIFAPRLGVEQDLASAFAIAAEVQARCRNDGYLVTRVRVPAQRIEGRRGAAGDRGGGHRPGDDRRAR